MLLTEFDEELHDKITFEAGKAEGRIEGEIKSLAELVVGRLLSLDVAFTKTGLSKEDFIQQAFLLNVPIKRYFDP